MTKYIIVLIGFSLISSATLQAACPYWNPFCSAQQRAVPQGSERIQKQVQEAVPVGTLPAVADLEWRVKTAIEYAKKKADCVMEISATMNKLLKAGGGFGMDSGSIDATLEYDYPQKCAGVHVCDKNGEVTPFTPAGPNFSQTPPPYSYGQWVCAKDIEYNIAGDAYLNYKVSAPLICNYSKGFPIDITFSYSSNKKPKQEFCLPADPAQSSTTYNSYDLGSLFSVTTVGELLDKMIAYSNSVDNAAYVTELTNAKKFLGDIGVKKGKNYLGAKTCMLSFPQEKTGVPFAMGPYYMYTELTFPTGYYFLGGEGHKVALKKMEISNMNSFYGVNDNKMYEGSNPNVCTVTVTLEKK